MMARLRLALPQITLGVFFIAMILPILAVGIFGFFSPQGGFDPAPVVKLLSSQEALGPIMNTIQLTVLTVVVGYALVIPSLVWMHLRAPRALDLAETASLLPYIIPAIALIGGVNLVLRPLLPGFFVSVYSLVPFYVLTTLPFMFRTVDTGLRALSLPTLMAASESLGSSTTRTFFAVVLPNLRTSILSGSLLVVMLASGEFAMASLMLHKTFPTFLVELGYTKVRLAAALSFLTILGSWIIVGLMLLVSRGKAAQDRVQQFSL